MSQASLARLLESDTCNLCSNCAAAVEHLCLSWSSILLISSCESFRRISSGGRQLTSNSYSLLLTTWICFGLCCSRMSFAISCTNNQALMPQVLIWLVCVADAQSAYSVQVSGTTFCAWCLATKSPLLHQYYQYIKKYSLLELQRVWYLDVELPIWVGKLLMSLQWILRHSASLKHEQCSTKITIWSLQSHFFSCSTVPIETRSGLTALHRQVMPLLFRCKADWLCETLKVQSTAIKWLTLERRYLSSSGTSIFSSSATWVIMWQIWSWVGAATRMHRHLLRTGSITYIDYVSIHISNLEYCSPMVPALGFQDRLFRTFQAQFAP